MSRVVSIYYQLLLDCSYSMEPIWENLQSQIGAHLERLEVKLNLISSTDAQLFARVIHNKEILKLSKKNYTFLFLGMNA